MKRLIFGGFYFGIVWHLSFKIPWAKWVSGERKLNDGLDGTTSFCAKRRGQANDYTITNCVV